MSVILIICQKDVSLGTAGSLVLTFVQVKNNITDTLGLLNTIR